MNSPAANETSHPDNRPMLDDRTDPSTATRAADRPSTRQHPVIFFDGICGLCNRFVDFVLPRDPHGVFRFAPLQGETARKELGPAEADSLDSVVLLDDDGLHRQTTAVIRVLRRLGGIWAVFAALLWLIPRPLRNLGYKLVARSRYAVFGKKESCRMPSPPERERFLS